MRISKIFIAIFLFCFSNLSQSQNNFILKPDRVFDGFTMHNNWVVQISNDTLAYVGPLNKLKNDAKNNLKILKGTTLLPGMIEGHGHIFLHPYSETSWNDQVLKESQSYRVARATVSAKKTLYAGFTSFRDLGTEGAGYADYGLKKAIKDGIILGPRMSISSKAIVATGSYGPKGFAPEIKVPLGAQEGDGENLIQVVRSQIAAGADFIKVYADYRWGKNKKAMPTFSVDELRLIVKTAASSGRYVAAHAATAEGMRRAIIAGIKIIEHGDGGTPEIFKMMKDKNVALCPTVAAGYSIAVYNGWNPKGDKTPKRITQKIKSFKEALKARVIIIGGGDVGVFAHGNNVLELEMMSQYGMSNLEILKSVTSTSAQVLEMPKVGFLKSGNFADIVVVNGNPLKNIHNLRQIRMVVKNGKIVLEKP